MGLAWYRTERGIEEELHMPVEAAKFAPLRFSTREIPERERMLRWREEFGQSMLHVDIRPLSEVPFQAEAILRPLTGLRMLSLRGSPMHLQRAQANLADSDESIGMIVNFNASKISQRGRNVVLGPGEAVALLHAEPAAVTYSSGSHLALVLPRDALASRVKDIDSVTMRLIPRHSEALRLLVSYLRLVLEKAVLATPELREAVATHVQDLAALSLGEHPPVGESSASAVVVARRATALDHITSSFQDAELTLATVARDLRISPRYLQRLLETSGTSFTAVVNELRLQRAFTLLTEVGGGERRISDVALQVGFSDISHFNRLFRSRFGDTPRSVRGQRQ
jgi:AraC-like DNA-binding protein